MVARFAARGHGRQSAVCPYADLSEDLYRAFPLALRGRSLLDFGAFPLVTVVLALAFRFA